MTYRNDQLAVTPAAAQSSTQTACNQLLQALLESRPAIQAAIVGSADGRAFAHAAQPGRPVEAVRVAAVASSLLALSESFSKEALGSRARYNSIATTGGTVVVVRVPTRAQGHVLCLWADQSDNFAMTLHWALDSAERIAALLDAG